MLIKKLKENFFFDLRKPDIEIFERATIIKSYMDENKLSERQFANKFGFNQSTIHDWLTCLDVTKLQMNKMLKNGWTKTDIYNSLRNINKVKNKLRTNSMVDDLLRSMIETLTPLKSTVKFTTNTKKLIENLKDMLDNMEKINKIKK